MRGLDPTDSFSGSLEPILIDLGCAVFCQEHH